MRGADLRLAVKVQEGPQFHEEDPLPLRPAPPDQGEEQIPLPLLQAEPQATPPLRQAPQEGWQLRYINFLYLFQFGLTFCCFNQRNENIVSLKLKAHTFDATQYYNVSTAMSSLYATLLFQSTQRHPLRTITSVSLHLPHHDY